MRPYGREKAFRVIVSHPAKQQIVYWWPMAMQEARIPVKFLTGIYYKPHSFPYRLANGLPARWRSRIIDKLMRRQQPGLDAESVVSWPWLELGFRPTGHIEWWNRAHDMLACGWICAQREDSKPTVVQGFLSSCLYTMRAARRRRMITVVEVTSPLSVHRILVEEYRRLGLVPSSSDRPPGRDVAEVLEADYVVAQSAFVAESLAEIGVPPRRTILRPFGVEVERFKPGSRQEAKRPFRALFVGQLGVRKGLHHLLEAWSSLGLPDAELVLAGEPVDETGRQLLRGYAGRHRWLGFVPHSELPPVYQDSDIFVLPSLAEGGSNATYEALASGLPSIVTKNCQSLVRDGIEGYVIKAGDVGELRDRIQRLYTAPELRRRMAAAARRRAERHTWQDFSRRLELMYEYVCSGGVGWGLGEDEIVDFSDV